jgi:hypothetical protein
MDLIDDDRLINAVKVTMTMTMKVTVNKIPYRLAQF